MKNLTAIDLFSGAGGLSLAAANVAIDVLAAIESDQHAASTYYKNLVTHRGAPTVVFAEDIRHVDIDSLMKYQGLAMGEVDLLLGGPPCQGFSVHRINDSGRDDPRNELLFRYFDFVKKIRPKAFLVENVPGLLWSRHADYLNKFLALSREHNYSIISGQPIILNARDYGVPQNRRRAFILAMRNDIDTNALQWPPSVTHTKAGKNPWLTASTVFERPVTHILERFKDRLIEKFNIASALAEECINNLEWGEPISDQDPTNKYMHHSEKMIQLFHNTPLLGDRTESGRTLKCHQQYNGHNDVYGRIYPHHPSNTITTGCNNPSKGRFVHPWLPQGISLRHAARLQTFPDNFVFEGGVIASAKQIGNAVPIQLGEVLLESIKKVLVKD